MLKYRKFTALYTQPEMLNDVIDFAKANSISVLAVQKEGFRSHRRDTEHSITMVTDLRDDTSVAPVCEAAAALMPNLLVFAVDRDRSVGLFTAAPNEQRIIQELLWLHYGKEGLIQLLFSASASFNAEALAVSTYLDDMGVAA